MKSSRLRYLIAYDICDPKRLRRVHKQVEAYAIGGQKSFYECWLTKCELNRLKLELKTIIEIQEDCILVFQISSSVKPLLFGKAKLQSVTPFLIV